MKARNEITIGQDVRYNNMTMFRKVNNNPFIPQYFYSATDELLETSNVVVNYIEYFKNSNGDIVNELTKYKYYVVPSEMAIGWYFSLATTPIQATDGIIVQIEATLLGLPMSVPDGYILQQPL